MAQARAALAAGDLAQAQALAGQASALDVPDSQFAPHEDRPSRLAADLLRAGAESSGATELADAALPTTATPERRRLRPSRSRRRTAARRLQLAQVPAEAPLPLPGSDAAAPLPDRRRGAAVVGDPRRSS